MAYQADGNQAEIVAALRARGAIVRLIEGANNQRGVPDLLVGWRGVTYLLEVKPPAGARKALRPEQVEFFASWRGGPAAVVHSVDEALIATATPTATATTTATATPTPTTTPTTTTTATTPPTGRISGVGLS